MSTMSLNWFGIKKIDSKLANNSTIKAVDKQQKSTIEDITRSKKFWQMAEIS